jgi:hypothetical protein
MGAHCNPSASADCGGERLAVSLRVLLHDTNTSHSLLGQLGKKNIKFVDAALDFDPKNGDRTTAPAIKQRLRFRSAAENSESKESRFKGVYS